GAALRSRHRARPALRRGLEQAGDRPVPREELPRLDRGLPGDARPQPTPLRRALRPGAVPPGARRAPRGRGAVPARDRGPQAPRGRAPQPGRGPRRGGAGQRSLVTFPGGLRALNHRDFRVFWTGQLVSLVGTWMQSVAQSWLVLQLSDSALKLGLIGTFQFAPVLLFSVVAGALADRLPKRRLILATQTALCLQALALTALVWTGHVRYWHVAVLALLLGCANVIDMPTRQAFIAELVGKRDLVNAVALNSAAFNGARIVGPAVAGLLIGRFGVAPAFLLNGLSFLVVIGALLLVHAEGTPRPRAATTVGQEVWEGLRYALGTPRIALILGLYSIVCMASCNTTLQLSAPDGLRGRVMSLYTLMFGGAFPVGAFMIGAIAEVFGVPTALLVAGSAGLVGVAAIALWWRARRA